MVLRAAVRVSVGDGDISYRHMVALMDPMYGYRKVAGAIIANTVKDVAESMIFLRDINTPQYRKLIQKKADKAHKKYKKLLENNAESKRYHREKIKGLRILLSETKLDLQAHREGLETIERPKLRAGLTPEERALVRRAIEEAERVEKNHTKGIEKCKESIAEIEEKIESHLRKVKRMKQEEKELRKRCSYRTQKKALRKRAQYEIQCAEAWFKSDQFERLNSVSQFSPEALMDLAKLKVNSGFDTGDKPYYLRSTVEGRDNL